MSGRSRHGLHIVRNGDASAATDGTPVSLSPQRRSSVAVQQKTVVLAVAGSLNADTAGRLRLFLAMFTGDGGPRELVLDLAGVVAVDEDGMTPIVDADEAMRLRTGSLRLTSMSEAVTHHLVVARYDRKLSTGSPAGGKASAPGCGPVPSPLDERPRPGRD